jgi:hypothetical protein
VNGWPLHLLREIASHRRMAHAERLRLHLVLKDSISAGGERVCPPVLLNSGHPAGVGPSDRTRGGCAREPLVVPRYEVQCSKEASSRRAGATYLRA